MRKLIVLFLLVVILVVSTFLIYSPSQDSGNTVKAQSTECDFNDTNNWCQVQRDPERTGYTPESLGTTVSVAWRKAFQQEKVYPQVQAIVYQDKVYVGTEMGNMYALNTSNGSQAWVYNVGSPILSSVAAYDGKIYFGAMDGAVYAINVGNGTLAWKKDLGGRFGFTTSPVIADNKVMLGGRNGVFYALDPNSGNVVWEYNAQSPILMTAAYDNGKAFFGTMDMYIHAVNTSDGTQTWKSIKIPQMAFKDYWPVVTQGKVIVRPMGGGRLNSSTYTDSAQDTLLASYDANPGNYTKSMFVLDEQTGQELPAVIHTDVDTMNGATTPSCVDKDGYLISPIIEPGSWRAGWGRLNLATRKILEVISNSSTNQGYGNIDENLNLSCAGNKVIVMHTQEGNAQYTGIFDLDLKTWVLIPSGVVNSQLSTNTQGAGGNPASIANGILYHISFNQLIARRVL